MIGNFHEVLETHQRLLANLDSALSQGPEARVGNIFLTLAPKLKSIHTTYCNCHPQAVCILDRYRYVILFLNQEYDAQYVVACASKFH